MEEARHLAAVTAFRDLPEQALHRLARASTWLEPRTGTQILTQGDDSDAVYAIVSGEGHVRIGAADKRSKSLMLQIARTGDIFGEQAVIEGMPRSADAVTEGRVRLARITGPAFLSVLEEFAALGMALCRTFSERLRRTNLLLEDAAFETLDVRLARQVLYLASRDSRKTETGIRLGGRFRQSDLADLLGATTRSIITTLNAWRAAGLVDFDATGGRLTITNEARLRALVSDGP